MIVKHTDPWTHYTWEDFLTFDEQKYVYDQCLDVLDVQSYHDDSFFYLNGEIQNNAGLHLNYGNELHNKIMSQLYEFSNLIGQRESFEKEVKYQPGTCFVFEANKYSYHGTDFTNDVNGYRFMISGELVESNDNE